MDDDHISISASGNGGDGRAAAPYYAAGGGEARARDERAAGYIRSRPNPAVFGGGGGSAGTDGGWMQRNRYGGDTDRILVGTDGEAASLDRNEDDDDDNGVEEFGGEGQAFATMAARTLPPPNDDDGFAVEVEDEAPTRSKTTAANRLAAGRRGGVDLFSGVASGTPVLALGSTTAAPGSAKTSVNAAAGLTTTTTVLPPGVTRQEFWTTLSTCMDRLEREFTRLASSEVLCVHCHQPVLPASLVVGDATASVTMVYPDTWTVPQLGTGGSGNGSGVRASSSATVYDECMRRRTALRLLHIRRKWMSAVTVSDAWCLLPCQHFVHATCRRDLLLRPSTPPSSSVAPPGASPPTCPACFATVSDVRPVPFHLMALARRAASQYGHEAPSPSSEQRRFLESYQMQRLLHRWSTRPPPSGGSTTTTTTTTAGTTGAASAASRAAPLRVAEPGADLLCSVSASSAANQCAGNDGSQDGGGGRLPPRWPADQWVPRAFVRDVDRQQGPAGASADEVVTPAAYRRSWHQRRAAFLDDMERLHAWLRALTQCGYDAVTLDACLHPQTRNGHAAAAAQRVVDMARRVQADCDASDRFWHDALAYDQALQAAVGQGVRGVGDDASDADSRRGDGGGGGGGLVGPAYVWGRSYRRSAHGAHASNVLLTPPERPGDLHRRRRPVPSAASVPWSVQLGVIDRPRTSSAGVVDPTVHGEDLDDALRRLVAEINVAHQNATEYAETRPLHF